MELDTGAAVTIISEKECKKLFGNTTLKRSELLLKTYSGERLPVIGTLDATVRYKDQERQLTLTVVAGDGPSLLGRDWLQHLTLDWKEIRAVSKQGDKGIQYLLSTGICLKTSWVIFSPSKFRYM